MSHADGPTIEEASVAEVTPNVAQGDFFETADAFFSGNLQWTLAALRRHFFAGGDARPVLAALQNRNRILIQLRALADATGGAFLFVGDDMTRLPLPSPTRVSSERHVVPVAPPWAWTLIAASLLGAHWIARRRSGLS